jgi:DNA-binding ferritin-like protein (Dps family)
MIPEDHFKNKVDRQISGEVIDNEMRVEVFEKRLSFIIVDEDIGDFCEDLIKDVQTWTKKEKNARTKTCTKYLR